MEMSALRAQLAPRGLDRPEETFDVAFPHLRTPRVDIYFLGVPPT